MLLHACWQVLPSLHAHHNNQFELSPANSFSNSTGYFNFGIWIVQAGIFSARGKITHANVEKGLVLSECLKILRREGEQQSWAKLWCKQIAAVVIFGVLFRSGEPEKHEPNASS
jgi:hypothetical protein